MLERFYIKPETVDRIRGSWIGAGIEQYVVWLTEQKYSPRCVFRRVPLIMRFGQFARDRGATKWEELPAHVEDFLTSDLEQRLPRRASPAVRKQLAKEARNPIQQLLRIIVPGFVGLGRSHKPANPFEDCAPRFLEYACQERGLRESTIYHYKHALWRFHAYLRSINLTDIRHLSPPVVSGFVVEYGKRGLSWASLRNACGVIRVFLRYLHREGVLAKDFSRIAEHPPAYRFSTIPRSITWDEVRRMLEQVDRRTPAGKRDYAMLLLLVTYGLRGHEVAALTLDDVDWRNDRLRIPERKAGHSTAYPLSAAVGQALLDYLKNGRPQTKDRHIFFRSVAPCRPVKSAIVSSRTARYLRKAGVLVPRPGSHTLRHTCVQRLVDNDIPFKVIGDYVGHRVPASTQIYTKVAVEALREVALGDGEEVL